MSVLAYVFWHQPRPDVARPEYEARLREFHKALDTRSAAFRVPSAPWAPDGAVYEDWYLLKGSADLDPLNDAAVSGRRKQPHDAAAQRSAWGTAGLYHLQLGDLKVTTARHAVWFSKPEGAVYEGLWDRLGPLCEITPAMLWQRHMVLGPTPEFCFLSARHVDLMDIVDDATYIALDPIVTR